MALSFDDFSFLGEELDALRRQIDSGRMVHALLITGESGYGKRSLSMLLAQTLLCSSADGKPCGKCNSCMMVKGNEHPDMVILEKGSSLTGNASQSKNSIPISDIREMIRICSAFPFEGNNRVILIFQAEDMNLPAQNALLKILEEPPGHTFFILTCVHTDKLLPTVISRCREFKMKPWDEKQIVDALTAKGVDRNRAILISDSSHGSVGYALQMAEDADYWDDRDEIIRSFFHLDSRSDILSVSNRWKERKTDSELLFSTLEDAVRMLLMHCLKKTDEKHLSEFPRKWVLFSSSALPESFSFLFDRISCARTQCLSNVNFQAIVEQLLLDFIGIIQETSV